MTTSPQQRSKRPWSWWLWTGYWMGLFVVTHVPVSVPGPPAVPHGDKIAHFGLYFLLTWLGGRYLASTGRFASGRSMGTFLTWAAVYVMYAALDEWLQQFVGRQMALGDWLADLAGIAAATVSLVLKPPLTRRVPPHGKNVKRP